MYAIRSYYGSFWRDDVPTLAIYTQTETKSIFRKDKDGRAVEKKKEYWKLAPRTWQDVNPHWNYDDGEAAMVEIYSNCEAVELFLNGRSLGRQFVITSYSIHYTKLYENRPDMLPSLRRSESGV